MAYLDVTGLDHVAAGGREQGETLFARGLEATGVSGGAVDLMAAHKWFNLAVLAGHASARMHREAVAADMSRAEIAAALRAARDWLARR